MSKQPMSASSSKARANVWDIFRKPNGAEWEKQKLLNATADFSQSETKSADGKTSSGPVANLIDEKDENTWVTDRGIGLRNQPGVAVVQFEKLWVDMTALAEVETRFVAVPRLRGQQLKDQAQLDGWLRDGSAAYVERLCDWK